MADCPACGYYTSDDRLLCVPCTRLVAHEDISDPRVTMKNTVRNRKVGADYTRELLFIFSAIYFGASGIVFAEDPYHRYQVALILGLVFFVGVISVVSAGLMAIRLLFGRFKESMLQVKNMMLACGLIVGIFAIFPMMTGEKTSNVIRHIFGAEYGYSNTSLALDTIAIPTN